MEMKDKLVLLLKNIDVELPITTAEYLIAGGVTMPEWISVNDRLPDEGLYLIVRNGKVGVALRQMFLFFGMIWNNDMTGGFSIISDEEVTHWMPLPQTPKGE